jgi:hypothetical protein
MHTEALRFNSFVNSAPLEIRIKEIHARRNGLTLIHCNWNFLFLN